MTQIAKRARVSPATIYTYFDSKFELIYEIYGRILLNQLDDIAAKAAKIGNPQKRVSFVLRGFWIECTQANGLLAHNFVQALSLLDDQAVYSADLLNAAKRKISDAMALGSGNSKFSNVKLNKIIFLVVMAFDGFAIIPCCASQTRKQSPRSTSLLMQ